MKTTITIITALVIAATGMARHKSDNPEETMRKEIMKFVEAKDKKTVFTHPGSGHYVWYFKYRLDNAGDTLSLPQSLARLDKAFSRNAGKSTTILSHNPDDGPSPFNWISFSWPDTYWSRISFRYNMKEDYNYRFATFMGPDTMRTCYAMVWTPETFYDKDSVLCSNIDGYIIKMQGSHWKIDELNSVYFPNRNTSKNIKSAQTDTIGFVELREKTKYIVNQYITHTINNDPTGCDAAVYFFHKIVEDFDGTLTGKQFDEINSSASKMNIEGITEQRRKILGQSLRMLQQKSKKRFLRNTWTLGYGNGRFIDNEYEAKSIIEKFILPEKRPEPIKGWSISGIATPGVKELRVEQMIFPENNIVYINVDDDGKFFYTDETYAGQFIKLSDSKGNYHVFIADSIPVFIDMEKRKVTASPQNMAFYECQQRLYDYEREAKKYITTIDNYSETIDSEGLQALIDSAAVVTDGFIRNNMDSPIGSYYLWQSYTNMSRERLGSLLDSTRAYSKHIAMQPVWEYYRNMGKRREGSMYTDVELTDHKGVSRRLSDYVGKGYVLLEFWAIWSGASRGDIPMLKNLNKRYKDKGLTIIGINMDKDGEGWARYVEKRGIHWTHLSDFNKWESQAAKAYGITSLPEYVLIGPDGRIVSSGIIGDRLKQKIEEIFEK